MHRFGKGHVPRNLRHDPGLGPSEREREHGPRPGQPLAVDVEGDSGFGLHTLTPQGHPQVEEEQLVEGESPMGWTSVAVQLPHVVVPGRLVQPCQGLAQPEQSQPPTQRRREWIPTAPR